MSTSSIFSSSPLVQVRNLGCTYTTRRGAFTALDDVSFDARRGQRIAFVGPSGAGKSTLLRCLNLLVRPTRGSVAIDGRDLTALDSAGVAHARRDIGMIFQHFALLHRRTVRENIALPLELAGATASDIDKRVDTLLERVRLSDKADAYPAELSGGQRQRVGIARALAHAPRIVLCDEPTSALDAETASHVTELLHTLAKDLQLTLVLVTHQLELVRALADDVAVLDNGQLRELTPVTEFFATPRSEAGRRLLAPELRARLPERLLNEAQRNAGVGSSTLLNVAVASNHATGVIFQTLSRYASLRFDVVSANIESLRGRSIGALSLLVHGTPTSIRVAIAALEHQAIRVEVVGHVLAAA